MRGDGEASVEPAFEVELEAKQCGIMGGGRVCRRNVGNVGN